jgi:hypothetical protein
MFSNTALVSSPKLQLGLTPPALPLYALQYGEPVNGAMSMGIHESQSLLWERMVALSRPFADYVLPKLKVCLHWLFLEIQVGLTGGLFCQHQSFCLRCKWD